MRLRAFWYHRQLALIKRRYYRTHSWLWHSCRRILKLLRMIMTGGNRVFVFVPCGRRNRDTDPPGHAAVIVTVFLLKEETSMEQIIKHFTPAMAAFAVGVLLIGILVAILSSNGVVAEQMNKIITGFFEAASAQLPA